MTETEKKIEKLVFEAKDQVKYDVTHYGAMGVANLMRQELLQRFASWHDDEMRKLKERCAEAGLQWFRGFRRTHVPQVPNIEECGLRTAILAVDEPPKPKSPFGCECWTFRPDGKKCSDFDSRWVRKQESCFATLSTDAKFCDMCGKPRVNQKP